MFFFRLFPEAFTSGDADSIYRVGRFLYDGKDGITPDFTGASKYFLDAAIKGHSSAQLSLGKSPIHHPLLAPAPCELRVHSLPVLAPPSRHSPLANFNFVFFCFVLICCLGTMFKHGQGVPQDYTKAIEYFTLSANQGNSAAQNNLGTEPTHPPSSPGHPVLCSSICSSMCSKICFFSPFVLASFQSVLAPFRRWFWNQGLMGNSRTTVHVGSWS